MRIKHWQGYGVINAKKVALNDNNDGTKTLKVHVSGNHEYGICCEDDYTIENWLVKRFDKSFNNGYIMKMDIRTSIKDGEDIADYKIIYKAS
jgi:hypothetical protein